MSKSVSEYIDHFSKLVSKQLDDYASDEVFLSSRYIFVERDGYCNGSQWAYCTHCRRGFVAKGLKHNTKYRCSNCGSLCTVKSTGMHRRNLYDNAYFVYFEKSMRSGRAHV